MWTRPFTISRSYLLPFLATCLFVIQLGLSLSDLPSIKLMQNIVCKHVHKIHGTAMLPEEDCRDGPVQHKLNIIVMGIQVSATISGTMPFNMILFCVTIETILKTNSFAAATVAFPLGVLADRIGRIPVLGASIFSMLLSQAYAMFICWKSDSIPLEAIWGLGVPLLLGGGRSVAEAMVFAIIADVVPDDKRVIDRVIRSTWFQWVVASVFAAQLVGPVLSGELVQPSIWMPLFLSLGLILGGGLILVAFTPETLKRRQPQQEPSIEPYAYGLESDIFNFESPKTTSAMSTLKSMFTRPLLWLLPSAVMAIPLATIQTDIVIRLMPIQFNWRLDRSILIISLRSLVTLLTLCILLPIISCIWTKLALAGSSAHHRNSILARASSLLLLAGSLCMMMVTDKAFIIAGLAVSALGSGLPMLCRAMLVGVTGEEQAGVLFGMLAVWEILGFLACEMGMGALFGIGSGDNPDDVASAIEAASCW
ncbi:hypothetical protein FSARC_5266 [Fusarium sarcochroum]|uniref:Major facilitator superfamily (MFS) profile domain-containing protein n=1 Tax=Fusarium sarcochroum TaxID=1208366 RepID=A0A8H4TZQ9_9HYPO|nr:hypothetical protein FSARC_5266 [Fusarium sarcochroum]